MSLDLNRVLIFSRVVEAQGFSAAARALGLPKSSVSRSVALLEEELGAALLRRTTRSVSLTDAGRAFYERAARGLEALREAQEAVVELESELRGRVRITAPVDAGAFLLAPVIADFSAQHPQLCVEVILTSRVVDLVEDSVDLALRVGRLRDPSLIARRLYAVDLALYASEAYLEARGTPKRLEDLAEHRAVLFGRQGPTATWELTGPEGRKSVEVQGSIVADDFAFVHRAALQGAGIALLPAFVQGDARLVPVLPAYTVPVGPMHLVYPQTSYLPRRVAALRDFIAEALGGRAVAPRAPSRRR